MADRHSVAYESLVEGMTRTFGTAIREYLIDASHLFLVPAGELAWTCTRCRRQHLHSSGGVCTYCLRPLPDGPIAVDHSEDYYAYLAAGGGDPFRLHCEELSGQTGRIESSRRQTAFQDIFLASENELVEEIDLLSVTTTMEAGVDIGAYAP